ncbi:Ig-like domain-containing protein [Nocardioides sediminis]|uniref:Ig-like domain-containing protein n=1 Tax=Nocardioides sediminis TaxID=433648 RepID=UPI000D30CBF8|nr:Ig-like domain-containing protein [Nocardioides sediminis]
MNKLHLALVAMLAIALGLLSPAPVSATTTTWNDGFHDEDQIIDCITSKPSTGVSANVGWSSPSGQVPKVGEKFYLRGYVGLVGLPCSGKVGILPEILVPAGIEFVEEDVRWDLTPAGQQQVLTTDPLAFDHGANGGILMGNADYSPFTLRQGDVLEFQFPVRATRELKGPATQQPQCQSRLDGDAPCPINQAGDHLQIAFTVTGHGGDKYYVTPFVGLFASPSSTPTPTTPAPTTPTSPAPAPAPGGSQQPGAAQGKAASTTTATWRASTARRGRAKVVVASATAPTGKVVVRDKGRTIARATLQASHQGRITVRLPRLRKGKHVLVAQYLGSPTVAASSSGKRTLRLR